MTRTLTAKSFARAWESLARSHPGLGERVEQFGPPPFWRRRPGFPTLVLLILEQQVSLASAKATYEKLAAVTPDMRPASLAKLDDSVYRSAGVSRQKTRYLRTLANAVSSRALVVSNLESLSDEAACEALIALPGIGRWTADTYLLMALRRVDIWPIGDLALRDELARLAGIPRAELSEEAAVDMGEAFRPYRSVATRIMWCAYLGRIEQRRRA